MAKKTGVKPSKEVLQKMIEEKGYRHAGRAYGVSDNTARRWAMAYGIQLKDRCVLKARSRTKLVDVDGKFVYPYLIKRKQETARLRKIKAAEKKVEMKTVAIKKEAVKSVKKKAVVKKVKPSKKEILSEEFTEEITTVFDEVVAVDANKLSIPEVVKAAEVKEPEQVRVKMPVQPSYKGGTKNRYTPQECSEFRELIMKKIQEEYESMCLLKDSLSRGSENGTASYSNAFDDGSLSAEREQLTELVAKKQKHLNALNAALGRTHNGTYGICVVTGMLIPKARLMVVPHATKCLEAKTESDNGKVITPQEHHSEETSTEV